MAEPPEQSVGAWRCAGVGAGIAKPHGYPSDPDSGWGGPTGRPTPKGATSKVVVFFPWFSLNLQKDRTWGIIARGGGYSDFSLAFRTGKKGTR